MLKKRIAATLIVKDGIVVQSINFKKYLPVGKPAIAIEFLNQWGIDEIILLDISATINQRGPDYAMIKAAAEKCYVPLTIGGGITKVEQIKELMNCGADKIAINQSLLNNEGLVTEAAHIFGNQCVVAAIDALLVDGTYYVYDYRNKAATSVSPGTLAKHAEEIGAGEILINSVDRDGSYLGYDLELIRQVCEQVTVPVICCGGAKNAKDFVDVFEKTAVSAASAANFFHFAEHSVNITKAQIRESIEVRLETFADYADAQYDNKYRLNKKPDQILENMLFMKIEKEII